MQSTISPALKWSIGVFTVAFIGLGSWLGYLVYKNQHQPTQTVAKVLPATITSSLIETPQPTATTTATSASSQSQATSTASTTVKATNAPILKQNQETPLTASIASASMNGQVMITIVANQPIVAGFSLATSASDYSQTKQLTVDSYSGTKTMMVRTKGGQTQQFDVSGSSVSSSATTQF